jgi:hypothetical protein
MMCVRNTAVFTGRVLRPSSQPLRARSRRSQSSYSTSGLRRLKVVLEPSGQSARATASRSRPDKPAH